MTDPVDFKAAVETRIVDELRPGSVTRGIFAIHREDEWWPEGAKPPEVIESETLTILKQLAGPPQPLGIYDCVGCRQRLKKYPAGDPEQDAWRDPSGSPFCSQKADGIFHMPYGAELTNKILRTGPVGATGATGVTGPVGVTGP